MLVLEWARWLIEGSTCLDQFPRDDCKTGTFREQKTVERNPAVWPSRHWQVLPCQGGGHRGKQLHLLLGEQQWPGQQMVGRVREVGEEPVRDGSRAQAQHHLHWWGEPGIIFSHNALFVALQYPQKMRLSFASVESVRPGWLLVRLPIWQRVGVCEENQDGVPRANAGVTVHNIFIVFPWKLSLDVKCQCDHLTRDHSRESGTTQTGSLSWVQPIFPGSWMLPSEEGKEANIEANVKKLSRFLGLRRGSTLTCLRSTPGETSL